MRFADIGKPLSAWVKIARLQFYPMTFVAYALGAMAQSSSGRLDLQTFWLGYLVLFLIEFGTILTNEYFDYETDRRNVNFSLFTGGTRVLVDRALTFQQVRRGIFAVLLLILFFSIVLIRNIHQPLGFAPGILIAAGLLLGLGYTVPPLQFAYRGLGEVVVGATHSPYVILCGFVFQGGRWNDPLPWLLAIPLFFAILAAIILAGIPDRQADQAVRKRTVAVLLGPRPAAWSAIGCALAAYGTALLLIHLGILLMPIMVWYFPVPLHGAFLVYRLLRLSGSDRMQGRIDREMGLALSYVIWFGTLPLYAFWR